MIRRLFTAHPGSVGETYLQHLRAASSFGLRLLLAAGACLVHALLPFAFARTASGIVMRLHHHLSRRASAAASTPGGVPCGGPGARGPGSDEISWEGMFI